MRKKMMFFLGLLIAGTVAYYSGYYIYISQRPKVEIETPMALQSGYMESSVKQVTYEKEYYIGKIEQEMLVIYKMPEDSVYDSMRINNLQIQENDYLQLKSGMIFESLSEVFEFLENCMS